MDAYLETGLNSALETAASWRVQSGDDNENTIWYIHCTVGWIRLFAVRLHCAVETRLYHSLLRQMFKSLCSDLASPNNMMDATKRLVHIRKVKIKQKHQ